VEPENDLADKLNEFVAYVDTAETAPDGSPFDRGSTDYLNVKQPLVEACIAAGSDIVITGPGG
jgi:hypothetical protein